MKTLLTKSLVVAVVAVAAVRSYLLLTSQTGLTARVAA
jgi:hypothetical protein